MDYVDACDRVKRCKEEAVFLREEARDALVYYRRQEDGLARAIRERTDSLDPVARSHKLLLEREMSKVQRLKARMLQTQVHLTGLFGEFPGAPQAAGADGATAEGDIPPIPVEEEELGGDPEVFPEVQDTEEETGDESEDEEEELARDDDDSGYTSVRGDDWPGDGRL